MKKRRKLKVILLSTLTIIMLATVMPMLTTPIRRPTNMVRRYILRITPIGTNINDVITIIENRGDWGTHSVDLERGFIPGSGARPPLEPDLRITVIGDMSIRVRIGGYRAWYKMLFLSVTDIGVFWGFDEDGNLIDVHVRKIWGP